MRGLQWLIWNGPRCSASVGVSRIDAQHKTLFKLVNEFCEAYQHHQGYDRVPAVLNQLIQYAQVHFRDEETLMAAAEYEQLNSHRSDHEELTEQVFELRATFEGGDLKTTEEVRAFLGDWLINHILNKDMKFKSFFAEKGIS